MDQCTVLLWAALDSATVLEERGGACVRVNQVYCSSLKERLSPRVQRVKGSEIRGRPGSGLRSSSLAKLWGVFFLERWSSCPYHQGRALSPRERIFSSQTKRGTPDYSSRGTLPSGCSTLTLSLSPHSFDRCSPSAPLARLPASSCATSPRPPRPTTRSFSATLSPRLPSSLSTVPRRSTVRLPRPPRPLFASFTQIAELTSSAQLSTLPSSTSSTPLSTQPLRTTRSARS